MSSVVTSITSIADRRLERLRVQYQGRAWADCAVVLKACEAGILSGSPPTVRTTDDLLTLSDWVAARPELRGPYDADQDRRAVPVVCPPWCTERHDAAIRPEDEAELHSRTVAGRWDDGEYRVRMLQWQRHPDDDDYLVEPRTEIEVCVKGACPAGEVDAAGLLAWAAALVEAGDTIGDAR